MTLQDKITLQSKNHFKALAFKEGFFYKVYNEGSWFLRSKNFKMQQIGKGSLKSVFVGFPESVMLSMANNYTIDTKSNSMEIATNELFDSIAYEDWKAKIESLIHKDIASTNQVITENAQKILFFMTLQAIVVFNQTKNYGVTCLLTSHYLQHCQIAVCLLATSHHNYTAICI